MGHEVSSKALYNQLLYFRSLWDLDKVGKRKGMVGAGASTGPVGGEGLNKGVHPPQEGGDAKAKAEAEAETEEDIDAKLRAVSEWNRERFHTCWAVVEGYLKRCGRVWVQMDELFRFAHGK